MKELADDGTLHCGFKKNWGGVIAITCVRSLSDPDSLDRPGNLCFLLCGKCIICASAHMRNTCNTTILKGKATLYIIQNFLVYIVFNVYWVMVKFKRGREPAWWYSSHITKQNKWRYILPSESSTLYLHPDIDGHIKVLTFIDKYRTEWLSGGSHINFTIKITLVLKTNSLPHWKKYVASAK